MGSSIFSKEDPILEQFLVSEKKKQSLSNSQHPYFPFEDLGPPLKNDGSLDTDFIKKYGITIPERMYLALGDNHAMSADSRDFGFVPEDNIRGAPDFIFWPYGSRWGTPNQPQYPLMTLPRAVVWSILGLGFAGYFVVSRRKNKLPFPLSDKRK